MTAPEPAFANCCEATKQVEMEWLSFCFCGGVTQPLAHTHRIVCDRWKPSKTVQGILFQSRYRL